MPQESSLYAPRYWSTWMGVGVFWLVQWLPDTPRQWLGRSIGKIAWRLNSKRRNVVNVNLSLCFPEWSEEKKQTIAIRHFEIMGQSLLDSSILWFGSDSRISKLIELEGWEHFKAVRSQDKNVIFHAAHSAGLEFGILAIGSREAGFGIYNPLKNPIVDHFVIKTRTRFGTGVSPRKDGFRPLIKSLKKGKLQFIPSDEDLGPELSVFVKLFAEPKATLYSVGRMAKLTNAAVLPVITVFDFEKKKYIAKIFPSLSDFPAEDPVEDANRLNQSLEEMIMLAPNQYMWTLKLFKTRQDGKRVY